ncbi:MAG TPA: alpha/beta fold hydrolase [Steroidobacteraceae bacterium]|nr:alpha/beta fold hydrolase [Steroidobacteraceae bacterium]
MRSPRAVAGLAALLALWAVHARASPPALALTPCQIEHPLKLTVLPAECAVLEVPENPQDPLGRQIPLHVARVPAISRNKPPDPLFVLAGGPGQAASAFYATVAGAFERIHRERDIVLVDQRGTGASNRLDCPEDGDALYLSSDAEITRSTRRCLEALSTRAHVAFYTTGLAVTDLERVRAALGYERIDLYGASYGTRVAQQYLRSYPARVRAVILDGVVPPSLVLGPAVATDAQHALSAILARCAADGLCHTHFPDPQADYTAVRATLAAHAVPVTVPDPSSGVPRPFSFGPDQLALVLRLGSYASEYASLLPLLLHTAAGGDYAPLAAQVLLLKRSYEDVATGMHNSVVCSEDVPFIDPRTLDRAALNATYLGASEVDGLAIVCGLWPRGPVPADLHAPLKSDVPALLLSGSDDPVTPPGYAAEAARGFARHREIVLPGFGHGQLTAPCMDRVMARFLDSADPLALGVACVANAHPMPFFLGVNGPGP